MQGIWQNIWKPSENTMIKLEITHEVTCAIYLLKNASIILLRMRLENKKGVELA
jgi:hypothetical protein